MWHVEIGLTIIPTDDRAALIAFLDDAYKQYRQLDVIDPEMLAAVGEGTATFSSLVDTEGWNDALKRASADVRTAIHAAGGSTPQWADQLEASLARPRVSATPVPG